MVRKKSLLLILIFIYNLVFLTLSLLRHQSLNSTYLDLGLESQAVWNTSQGRLFEVSFGSNGQLLSSWAYHATPIILLLAPFSRIFSPPLFLLVVQTFVLSLGAVPVFLLAEHLLKGRFLPWAFSLAYLLYPPLEYSNLFDFHYITLATTFLLFAFYLMVRKNWTWFSLFLVLAVSTKENVALVASLLGIYLFFFEKERLKGLFIFLVSLFYFFFIVSYLFPKLSGGFAALGRYDYLGQTPLAVIFNLILDPLKGLKVLFPEPKVKYIFHLLVSVGFLPLLSPLELLPSFSEFFLNLFSSYNPQWQVKFHYTAAVTPFIFVAAIYGTSHLTAFLPTKRTGHLRLFLSLYLISLSLLWNIVHSPSPLYYKFDRLKYTPTSETREALKALAEISEEISVSAMNNLGAHLSRRRFLYRFPINYLQADYVVLDPFVVGRDFDLAQVSYEDYQVYLSRLQESQSYKKIVDRPRLLVYRRIAVK